jgi:hypothetical protein
MADLSLIKIWELDKSGWYDGERCSIPEELRDWLPITQYESENKRVTVRAPYPIGDYDKYMAVSQLDGAKIECAACAGTGKTATGKKCAVCNGTGVPCDDIGAISIDDSGVIHLQIDTVTMGINAEGKLFARLKLKENGGLERDADDAVYVKVDDSTIKIDENGQLYAVTIQPYAEIFNEDVNPDEPITLFTVDDGVEQVKLHIAVDITSTKYDTATELTRFDLIVGGTKMTYCWDKTVPYTMINFDAIVDVPSNKKIVMTLDPLVYGDNFNDSKMKVLANVISC